jgi:REP element-mobilizing transposase RayT
MEYGGAFYHVMARGNRRERIFRDEGDRVLFYQTLGEACERTGWRVHAWVLMSNHCHVTGDARRCEREVTGSPIQYTEIDTGGCVQAVC